MGETASLDADSEHMQPPGETCPGPVSYCHPATAVTKSSNGHYTILSSKLLHDGRAHGTISELHEHGPIAALYLHEINCLDEK